MKFSIFMIYNVLGGLAWGAGISLLGFWLGNKVPNIDRYVIPVVFLAIIASFAPVLIHLAKNRFDRNRNAKDID